jgi:transposase-like protein
MVKATAQKLKDLLERSLSKLELAVLMIDGVRVGGHTVVVALGIDTEGHKHVLGLWQGSTENARVAKSLLEELMERGLDTERPLLVVLDGSKALRRAVTDILGEDTPVQRCTVHKKRNVLDHVPKQYQRQVSMRMTRAYNCVSAEEAQRELLDLENYLESINPSAAKSLREGMDETLTLHRLGIPEALRRSLQSTNIAESAIAVVRQRIRNVKRWTDGGRRSPKADQVQRWIASGLLEAEKRFRRVNGYAAMTHLINSLTNLRQNQQDAA